MRRGEKKNNRGKKWGNQCNLLDERDPRQAHTQMSYLTHITGLFCSSWFHSQVCRALGMPRAEHGGAVPPSLLWLQQPNFGLVFCTSFWVRAPAGRFNRLLLRSSWFRSAWCISAAFSSHKGTVIPSWTQLYFFQSWVLMPTVICPLSFVTE